MKGYLLIFGHYCELYDDVTIMNHFSFDNIRASEYHNNEASVCIDRNRKKRMKTEILPLHLHTVDVGESNMMIFAASIERCGTATILNFLKREMKLP